MWSLRPPLGGLFLFVLILACPDSSRADRALCPNVFIHSNRKLEFTKTETRLLCGDKGNESWATVPPYQARLFMTGFLQSRGFLLPEYRIEGDVLHVYPGGTTKLKEIRVVTGEEKERGHIKDEVLRQYRGRILTPRVLSSIEADGKSVVRQRGYPCAKVESEAITDEKTVTLRFRRLVPHDYGTVARDPIEGLHENALLRFYPFEENEPFNERLLDLTSKRMGRSEVVSGTYFLENCSEDAREFSLSQHFILGPARSIRFGVGANTEAGPIARFRWANNRFQHMASQLSATLETSLRVQTIRLTADQFLWPEYPRRSLFSQFDLTRESQYDYLQTVARLRPHIKWTSDHWKRFWTYRVGPTFETGTYKFKEDLDSQSYKNMALEGGLSWMSHNYEYFEVHPEEGDNFAFNVDYRDPAWGFTEPLLKLDSTVATLGRIGVWERGNVVAGVRLIGGATFVPASTSLFDLPPSVKFYGGGSDDIRGFLLRTLPQNDGLGALTKLVAKAELRRTYLVRQDLEGFIFLDGGRFGETSWNLDQRIWYSPGVGLRWFSPIGMVQTYAARARATAPKEDFDNFYFIGLGGTF